VEDRLAKPRALRQPLNAWGALPAEIVPGRSLGPG
jgi:hypothetical protein